MAKSQEIVAVPHSLSLSLSLCVLPIDMRCLLMCVGVCKRIVAIIISSVETTAAVATSSVQRATSHALPTRVSPSSASLTFMWHLKSICTTIEFSPFLSVICYCECLSLLLLLLLSHRYDTDSSTDRQMDGHLDSGPDDAFTCQLAIYACNFARDSQKVNI